MREDVYGHIKRLQFIGQAIDGYARESGIASPGVVDVGCGTGVMTSFPLADAGYRVTGVDIDRASIEFAIRMLGGRTNPTFVCADVSDIGSDEGFDVAICSEVLEHVGDPETLLAAIRSALRPGGLLVVTVPNGFGWFEMEQFWWRLLRMDGVYALWNKGIEFLKVRAGKILGVTPHGAPEPIKPASLSEASHVQRFTLGKLRRLFDQTGFRLLRQRGSTLVAGRFSHVTVGHFGWFNRANAAIVDHLPLVLASGWFFLLRKDASTGDRSTRRAGSIPGEVRA